jgi:hypothetical protein
MIGAESPRKVLGGNGKVLKLKSKKGYLIVLDCQNFLLEDMSYF